MLAFSWHFLENKKLLVSAETIVRYLEREDLHLLQCSDDVLVPSGSSSSSHPWSHKGTSPSTQSATAGSWEQFSWLLPTKRVEKNNSAITNCSDLILDNQLCRVKFVPCLPEDHQVSAGPHTNGTLWTSAQMGEERDGSWARTWRCMSSVNQKWDTNQIKMKAIISYNYISRKYVWA